MLPIFCYVDLLWGIVGVFVSWLSFFFPRLFMICMGYPLFLAMASIVFRSFLDFSVIGSVIILFIQYQNAAISCSCGRLEEIRIVVSVHVVFL